MTPPPSMHPSPALCHLTLTRTCASQANWNAATKQYVDERKFPADGSSPYSLRYVGSMVRRGRVRGWGALWGVTCGGVCVR
jgi:hypothetical protein